MNQPTEEKKNCQTIKLIRIVRLRLIFHHLFQFQLSFALLDLTTMNKMSTGIYIFIFASFALKLYMFVIIDFLNWSFALNSHKPSSINRFGYINQGLHLCLKLINYIFLVDTRNSFLYINDHIYNELYQSFCIALSEPECLIENILI